jgi:hypothetical protein
LQIALYVENGESFGSLDEEDEPRRYVVRGHGSRRRLAALRLVSKAFCSGASPRLFRHIIATVSCSQKVSPLVRLFELSNSPYAVYVRQVDLGFQHFEHSAHESHPLYAEDLAGLLPCCLVKLPNLNALEFHGPPSSLPQDKRRVFINTVVAALHYVPLLNLTELEVTFPITHDFGQLFCSNTNSLRIPIERVLRGLRHLGLYVSEYTNLRGQRYGSTPVSPENAALPNEIYATHLFRLVELSVNLNSLAIGSTDLLSLDNIQFGRSLRLKSLYLSGVALSSHTLLSLVEQSNESIRSVQLWLVKLNSGTWQHILSQMSKLPHLLDFVIDSSGYSLTGTSSNLATHLLPPPDDPEDIETLNFLDVYALGDLQRQVNVNRTAAGLSSISKYDYRHIHRQTLESMVEQLGLGGQGSA